MEDKKDPTWRQVGEAENYLAKPYPQQGSTQLGEISADEHFSQRNELPEHPSLGLHQREKLSKHLTWKTNESNVQSAIGN